MGKSSRGKTHIYYDMIWCGKSNLLQGSDLLHGCIKNEHEKCEPGFTTLDTGIYLQLTTKTGDFWDDRKERLPDHPEASLGSPGNI